MHPSNRWHRNIPWLVLTLGVVITAIVYWPGTAGGWIFDDFPNIVDNAAIHITPGHSTLAAWVNSAVSSPSSFLRRPLASLTFSLNWYFGGADPLGFKVVNIVIHLVNGVLVFAVLRALLRFLALHGRIEQPAATRLALIVAIAWMLLPINLMAVLYVVQRMESLCQVFVLAGLWAYLHGRWMMVTATVARDERRGLALAAGGIVLGTLLGLTSKESAVLLPVFAFLAEWIVLKFSRADSFDNNIHHANPSRLAIPGRPEGSNPESVLLIAATQCPGDPDEERATDSESTPRSVRHGNNGQPSVAANQDKRICALFVVTLFIPAALGTTWQLRGALNTAAWVGRDFTLGQRLLTEARVLVDYLHWTLLPNPTVLSLYHDEIVKSTGLLSPWTTLASIVLLATLLVVALWLRSRRPLVALGILWFFAAQLLTATIIPLELVFEQRMYFASIGVLLAASTILIGPRWKIRWGLLRGFLVTAALLWFAVATNLRAQEWSNPLRLAIAEANRHPESPRAVYAAGRLLLIASNYEPGKLLDESERYLHQAAALPGASTLPVQALIMIVDHHHIGDDAALWQSMIQKLRNQPTRQEDISTLVSLTSCYLKGACRFDPAWLQRAFEAALSRPHPISRLEGAYADFQRDIRHNDAQAEKYLARAVSDEPSEPAYRVDLAALYARHGQTALAEEQLRALRKLNYVGRLDGQIASLERMVETGGPPLERE